MDAISFGKSCFSPNALEILTPDSHLLFSSVVSYEWYVPLYYSATHHIELLPQDTPFLQRGGGLSDDRVLKGHHRLTQPEGKNMHAMKPETERHGGS